MTEEKQAISDRREKWKIYNIHRPCPVCRWHKCEKSCQRFKVEPNKIRKWWDEIDYINACNPKKRWLEGAGRPTEDKNIEEKLQEKICSGRSRKLSVSGKPIMTKTLYDVPSTDNPTSQGTFVARRGWLQKFMSVWIILQLRSIIISFFIHGLWLTEYLHVKGHTEFSLYVLIFLCQKYLK